MVIKPSIDQLGRARRSIVIAAISTGLLAACRVNKPYAKTAVFSYREFGPQAAVYPFIGMEWYQWNTQGPDNPNTTDDVEIVVYRNASLAQVKETFPVLKGKKDYRYFAYHDALDYLKAHENDPLLQDLKKTRKKLIKELGPE